MRKPGAYSCTFIQTEVTCLRVNAKHSPALISANDLLSPGSSTFMVEWLSSASIAVLWSASDDWTVPHLITPTELAGSILHSLPSAVFIASLRRAALGRLRRLLLLRRAALGRLRRLLLARDAGPRAA